MPLFKYKGIASGNSANSIVESTVEAADQAEAITIIRRTCEQVLEIREISQDYESADIGHIKPKALSLMCKQFSIILKSGIPLLQAVNLVAGQTDDKTVRKLLEVVAEDVSSGMTFGGSISVRAPKLPITFKETIRAGEESGGLVDSFERMSAYYDKSSKLKAKLISTLTYPAFVIVVAIFVVIIIMTKAIPSFTKTFESMGTDLPAITKLLINSSDFALKYGPIILGVVGVAVAVIFVWSRSEEGGIAISSFMLRIPVIGPIIRMTGAAQFARTMSSMISCGMPILRSVDIASRSMSSKVMAKEAHDSIEDVEGGMTLGTSLSEAQYLPKMLVEMLAIGEKSGNIEETLDVLADYYDNEVDVKSQRALSLLEPAIICFLALGVMVILFGVYLPMFNMSSGIH